MVDNNIFWSFVKDKIEKKYLQEYFPKVNKWKKKDIEFFLTDMVDQVEKRVKEDFSIRKILNIETGSDKKIVITPPSYDTFRRLFLTQESTGSKYVKNIFSIYLGYQSYEDLINENPIVFKDKSKLVNSKEIELFFDTEEFTPEDIVEFISYLSEIYSSIGGDYLTISGDNFYELSNDQQLIMV